MTTPQVVGILANVAIYVLVIAFVLFRQMTAQQIRPARLVLLPAIFLVFAVQQLTSQHLSLSASTVAYLGINLGVSIAAGIWRGTTFRMWAQYGAVMMRGTRFTLAAWAVLIAVRVVFAFAEHATKYGQGVVIGELLLALAVTFATQNIVIWLRAAQLTAVPMDTGEVSITGRGAMAYTGSRHRDH